MHQLLLVALFSIAKASVVPLGQSTADAPSLPDSKLCPKPGADLQRLEVCMSTRSISETELTQFDSMSTIVHPSIPWMRKVTAPIRTQTIA